MTTIPFSLSLGDSVHAKLIAINIKGSSIESGSGNGATIITKPGVPLLLAEVTDQRTKSTLGLTWNAGASDGGSVVIDYRISIAE